MTMTYRERFHETMRFGHPDRVPYWEMGFWGQTIERWEDEGMPPDQHHIHLFGFDRRETVPINHGIIPGFREEIVEENERFVIARRGDGVLSKQDMCYKTASIISPKHFREFMVPRYQRITALMRKHGVQVILVDSDGHVDELIPLWLEGGLSGVYPFEVAAGEDVVAVRKQYPRLHIWGGIDKRVLAQDKRAIEAELYAKVPFMLERGGYIPGIDHAVPHDVSYENWLYYREVLHRICERG